jgi:hypothetical protein
MTKPLPYSDLSKPTNVPQPAHVRGVEALPCLGCRRPFTPRRVGHRTRVLAHEGVVDSLVALEYLAMHLALTVVPELAARCWEHSLDRQQEPHLLRLENSALRIDERNTLTLEDQARLQLRRRQVIVNLAESSHMLESGEEVPELLQ